MTPELPTVIVLLIAPAFLTVWMSREFSPAGSDTHIPANTLVLQALAVSAVVIGLAFFAVSLGSLYDNHGRVCGGLSAVQLFSEDPWGHVQSNPGGVIWVASAEYCGHLALFILLGFLNPIDRIVSRRLRTENLHPEDTYVLGVEGAREALGATQTFARLRLTGGSIYTGTIQAISFEPLADGSRNIFLQRVVRLDLDEDEETGTAGNQGLLVNSQRVLTIELSYGDSEAK